MSIEVMQPNLYCVRDVVEQLERLSIFNLTVKIHNEKLWEQKSVEFGDVIFDTHRGELDEKGITPALIECQRITSRHENKNDIKLQCNIRKPIQIKLTPASVENLFNFKETMNGVFCKTITSKTQTTNRPILPLNNIKSIRKLIGDSSSIEFNLTKISINFMTSLDRVVSLALFKWNNKIDVRERLKQISYATNIETVSMNTQNSMILHPTSIGFECLLSQEKWSKRLVILSNFTSNNLHLQIDPNDFWTFAKVQLDFWSCMNRCFKSTNADESTDQPNNDEQQKNVENLESYQLPRLKTSNRICEEYFQDDLR